MLALQALSNRYLLEVSYSDQSDASGYAKVRNGRNSIIAEGGNRSSSLETLEICVRSCQTKNSPQPQSWLFRQNARLHHGTRELEKEWHAQAKSKMKRWDVEPWACSSTLQEELTRVVDQEMGC